jgi:hypothetical protein
VGQSQPSTSNPHKSLACKNISHPFTGTLGHNFRAEISVISNTGGIKRFINADNTIAIRYYVGSSSSTNVIINIDTKKPEHCSETNSCEDVAMIPSSFQPDLSKVIF